MGSVKYNLLRQHFNAFSELFGGLSGYLILEGNTAVATNGNAALVVGFPSDAVVVPFTGNVIPASVVRAICQLPRLESVTVGLQGDRQRVFVKCGGGISSDFVVPPSEKKILGIARRLFAATDLPAVEELGIRKLTDFAQTTRFGEFTFLKPVLKPVLGAVKKVHPLAPRSTLVQADIAVSADLLPPNPVAVLRLKAANATALVLRVMMD